MSISQDDKETVKVFCIGLNKTGTTSLERALSDLGYRMGNQRTGERLLGAYLQHDFRQIIKLTKTADAFQDIPFSLPFTYVALAQAYRDAKLILSVRDSAEQWYNSNVNYMGSWFGGKTPTATMLADCDYCYKGWMHESIFEILPLKDSDPFDRNTYIEFYNAHNANAEYFFRGKNSFLKINLSNPTSYQQMCAFLGKTPAAEVFAWLNSSNSG